MLNKRACEYLWWKGGTHQCINNRGKYAGILLLLTRSSSTRPISARAQRHCGLHILKAATLMSSLIRFIALVKQNPRLFSRYRPLQGMDCRCFCRSVSTYPDNILTNALQTASFNFIYLVRVCKERREVIRFNLGRGFCFVFI